MGHLRAIIEMHRRRAAEQQTSTKRGTLATPLLKCGGPPRYDRSIDETPIEHSLRSGLNPSHTGSTIVRAEAHEAGPVYLHFPPRNHNLESRLGGLRTRSLSPPSTGNGGAAQPRRSSLGAIVAFSREISSQDNLASSAVARQTRDSPAVATTAIVVHRPPALSQTVSRVMEAARTGTSSHSSDLALGGNSEDLTEEERPFSGGPRRPGRGPGYGENSSREGFSGTLEENFCKQWAHLSRTLGGRRVVETLMLALPDSESLLGDTHAYIIQRTFLAQAHHHVMSTHPPSSEWERVVRAVPSSVFTSLQTSWPGISLVGSATDAALRAADLPHSPGLPGLPNGSDHHQLRPDGVSSHQSRQPAPSNHGGSDQEHNRSVAASTVSSPPQAAAPRENNEAFEVDHLQVLRELLVATGDANHGDDQRSPPGMEDAIRNAATQVVRSGVRAGLAAAASGQPFPFADVPTKPTRPLPSPRGARRGMMANGGGPPQAHAAQSTPERDPSPMDAQEEYAMTWRTNMRTMARASAAEAVQPAQRSRSFGANPASRQAMSASSSPKSDSSGDEIEEDEVEQPLNSASESPGGGRQGLNQRGGQQTAAGLPQDPRPGRTQSTRASHLIANCTTPTCVWRACASP